MQGRDVCQSLAGGWILTVREMEVIWTGCCGDSLDTKLPGNAAVMLMRWIVSKASTCTSIKEDKRSK